MALLLHLQAIGVPDGVATLAEVANEMIVQAGCDSVGKLIKQIYPSVYSTPEELKLTVAELQSIAAANPQLAQCAMALVAAA